MDITQAITDEIPRLRRFARGLSASPDLADDLVQDCLERALINLDKWRENSNIRAWLFTILRNLHLNQIRAAARRPSEVSFDGNAEPVVATPPAQGQRLRLVELESALDQLPLKHREVLLLIGMEGMNYKEAAEILDVPTGTIMSRLSRGRERLRTLIDTGTRGGKSPLRRVK